jgi:hypothetical protein
MLNPRYMKLLDAVVVRRFVAAITLAWFCLPLISQAQDRTKSEADSPIILLDSATVTDYGELAARVKTLERISCSDPSRYFDHPMTVRHFVDAKLKTIRVLRYSRQSNPPKAEKIQKLVRNAWQGSFQSAACGILWSEGAAWSIESALEFEDGEQGVLITDGIHFALRDHDGKNWFFRLLPAAQ